MAKRYLIDTSIIIKYLNESLNDDGLRLVDSIIDEEYAISFVSEIELQVWNPPDEADLEVYKLFVLSAEIVGIDNEIVSQTIRIRKLHSVKLPDALIAATAISRNLTLVADNDKDFLKIYELDYVNPNTIAKS